MSVHTDNAIATLARKRREIDQGLAEMIQLIQSADRALFHDDSDEAARLLTAAADLELKHTGDTRTIGALQDALGLKDGVLARVEERARLRPGGEGR